MAPHIYGKRTRARWCLQTGIVARVLTVDCVGVCKTNLRLVEHHSRPNARYGSLLGSFDRERFAARGATWQGPSSARAVELVLTAAVGLHARRPQALQVRHAGVQRPCIPRPAGCQWSTKLELRLQTGLQAASPLPCSVGRHLWLRAETASSRCVRMAQRRVAAPPLDLLQAASPTAATMMSIALRAGCRGATRESRLVGPFSSAWEDSLAVVDQQAHQQIATTQFSPWRGRVSALCGGRQQRGITSRMHPSVIPRPRTSPRPSAKRGHWDAAQRREPSGTPTQQSNIRTAADIQTKEVQQTRTLSPPSARQRAAGGGGKEEGTLLSSLPVRDTHTHTPSTAADGSVDERRKNGGRKEMRMRQRGTARAWRTCLGGAALSDNVHVRVIRSCAPFAFGARTYA
ncbi:hypothetical protein JIQ42_06002 [Leishmania sp. Namibia]|uniref:hypothetical protein n=1 Tax=Leishmania sp. Namibia TaxID=2802991 RepID=UPI001B76BA0B|nr:hypothetical protein JIQ42_06002 [Leishmania sp. Namibia]